jgi:uncharacterized protein
MKKSWVAACISGILFGVGLAISGMTDPRVVQGFLDIFGAFNPRLIFVLGGAVGVTMLVFRFVLKQEKPIYESEFQLPLRQHIDVKLIAGAALFGIGWGLAGYCPGPALVGLTGGMKEAFFFVPAMLIGSFVYRWVSK